MFLGDLQYENVLPPQTMSSYNVTFCQQQLIIRHSGFDFINQVNHFTSVDTNLTSTSACALVDDYPSPVIFPELSYALFIIFVLLMPVVVLNVLVCVLTIFVRGCGW